MAQIIGLPKLSPTMEEGVLLRWVKKEGDKVSPGDLVAEVETDKANMDFTMEEGVLVRWVKKEGDKVSPGDLVAEVETDKANMDFNLEDEGTLLKFLVKEGDTVKLGAPVMILGKAGEDVSALVAQASSSTAPNPAPTSERTAPTTKPPPVAAKDGKPTSQPIEKPAAVTAPPTEKPQSAKPENKKASPDGARVLASPLAKSLAIELGIDLRNVTGSGPGGRIVERDVKAASKGHEIDNGKQAPAPQDDDEADAKTTQAIAIRTPKQMVPDTDAEFTDVTASNMRKRIAARLTEAKRDIPHFYLQRQIDAAPLLAFRGRLNELLGDKGKVSVNDLVVKATALALRRVPDCNAAWVGEAIRKFHHVHIGIAVAIEDGLVTPVIRNADQKGIGSIAAEVRDLAERAKHKGLKGHEITGSTFTISNLGMYGIEEFSAIINPPEGAILAVGAIVEKPVVVKGVIGVGQRMRLTLSCDHRVIDGALGAKWLQAFAELIEKPESLAL